MGHWGPIMGRGIGFGGPIMGPGIVFGGLGFLLLLLVVVVLVVWAVVRVRSGGAVSSPPRPSPLDIAKERYARGEILREEFEQLKKDLS